MNVRKVHTAVVFLLSFISTSLCVYALDDVLIEPPLTWSIDSLQIGWLHSHGESAEPESMYIYHAHSESECTPLSCFGLYGTDVNASAYEEGGFNYNQTDSKANPAQWSDSEKEKVSHALTEAFESDEHHSSSKQRLVFSVDFVNHTNSHLKFDHRYTNAIPVYIGQTEIGKAAPVGIDKAVISIPPTDEPVSVKFAMPIDEKCKLALLNNKPVLKFSEGQLFFRIPVNDPKIEGNIYRKSVVDKDHFTVAILAGSEVKEWKINWIEKNPVTLQEALETINDKTCLDNTNDAASVFEIKDNRLVSVCGVPFTDKNASDWITELKVFKDDSFQTLVDPDSCLSESPRNGERYVFQLANQEIKKLIAKANAGNIEAICELAGRYNEGDGVPEDKAKAFELYRKAAESGDATAQFNLGYYYFYGVVVPEDKTKALELYVKAADSGCAEAQYILGQCYFNGDFMPEDKSAAIKLWHKAADQGNAEALNALAYSYNDGKGTPKDKVKAVELWRKAAELGYSVAQFNLGMCYFNGEGVPEDKAEAVKWYRKAAGQGYPEAQYNLGMCYFNGVCVPEDKAEAIKWCRMAAENCCAEAQFFLGECYYKGVCVPEDKDEAIEWYHIAAEHGSADAQYILGACYYNGDGVPEDKEEAVKWYHKAAEHGNASAQYILGACYFKGVGVPEDKAEAVKWYLKAAQHDNTFVAIAAMNNLGVCYGNGDGVEKDLKESASWYRKAAEKGYAIAQFNLGDCYYNGDGVEKDLKEAASWYRKAAESGLKNAQFSFGNCYRFGEGVSKDIKEAKQWYQKAAQQGYEDAVKALNELTESDK